MNRGVAVWNGKVYVATGDCRLVAIDAAKGTSLWDSPICDPRQTGRTDAPRVAGGKVFVGYNGSDDEVRGALVAFDADTASSAAFIEGTSVRVDEPEDAALCMALIVSR